MQLEDRLNSRFETDKILNDSSVSSDLVSSLIGEKIGFGTFRDVFLYNMNPDYVVKIEKGSSRCNIVESMLWEEIEHLTGKLEWVKNWFAPVSWISPNGKILVMKKTSKKPGKKKPSKVPKFLWDVKDDNFGWIGNNFVCHDYGQFYNFINYSKTMKNHKWWE